MTTKSPSIPASQVAEPILTDELPPLPELDSLADIKHAHEWPDDWDADYRSIWQKLQVAERNKMQWRVYALQLRAALGRAVAPSEPTEAYWATTSSGERCAFGVKSWATSWAGKDGTVETVKLTQLALVESRVRARAGTPPADAEAQRKSAPEVLALEIAAAKAGYALVPITDQAAPQQPGQAIPESVGALKNSRSAEKVQPPASIEPAPMNRFTGYRCPSCCAKSGEPHLASCPESQASKGSTGGN